VKTNIFQEGSAGYKATIHLNKKGEKDRSYGRKLLLASVDRTEFQTTKAYFKLDLT
jgi:hypothetical protein